MFSVGNADGYGQRFLSDICVNLSICSVTHCFIQSYGNGAVHELTAGDTTSHSSTGEGEND